MGRILDFLVFPKIVCFLFAAVQVFDILPSLEFSCEVMSSSNSTSPILQMSSSIGKCILAHYLFDEMSKSDFKIIGLFLSS
ncbi:hypothetical protein ACFX2A_020908 [Malus domestica]